jgi:hypothetical protein
LSDLVFSFFVSMQKGSLSTQDMVLSLSASQNIAAKTSEEQHSNLNTIFTQGISGFLDFIHHQVFEGTRHFGNWICFHPQVKGGKEDTYSVGPLRKS